METPFENSCKMTHLELIENGLHNTLIRFRYHCIDLVGVVVDDKAVRADEKYSDTQYIFIPKANLIAYDKARSEMDLKAIKELSRIIDITAIRSGERI
jgi:hypothetical protein